MLKLQEIVIDTIDSLVSCKSVFQIVIDPYHARVYNLIFSLFFVEDLFSHVFLKLCRALESSFKDRKFYKSQS